MKNYALGLLFVGGLLAAQEARILTLPEAISYALQHKAEAEKARLDIRRGDAQIAEAKSTVYPNLSFSSNTTYNPIPQDLVLPGGIFNMPGKEVKIAMGQPWNSSNTLQLTQTVFNQSVFTGLKAAKSTKEFYLINAQLTEEQVIEKVAQAYFHVYRSQQMLANAESNLKITGETSKIIKGMFDAGLARKIDFDRTEVARNNISSSRQQLANAVAISCNALKFMIGMPMEEVVTLPEQTFDAAILPDTDPGTIDTRTELRLANKQIELLEWQKKEARSQYYPTVSLSVNYGVLGDGEKLPWFYGQKNGVSWSTLANAGIHIHMPIFNGFATKAKIELSQIEIEKAQADLREIKLGLDMAHKNAVNLLENSLTTIHMQRLNVKLAQDVLSNTRSNYQHGLATLNDILDADRDLAEAKNNLTEAQLDYKLAEIDLLKSQGKLKTLNN